MIRTTKDKNDLMQILKLENSLFEKSKYTFEQLCEMLTDDKYSIWIFNLDKIIAYAIVYENIDFFELFKIGVAEECQNGGIGSKLLSKIQSKIKGKTMNLEVSSKNLKALSFYEKMGFKKNGLRKNYYGKDDDGVLMEWSSDFSLEQ